MPIGTKYTPLGRFLADQPPTITTITLTFAEIERLIGGPLPRSARRGQGWSNSLRATKHAWVWLDAGWRVKHKSVWLAEPTVTFVRADTTRSSLADQRP